MMPWPQPSIKKNSYATKNFAILRLLGGKGCAQSTTKTRRTAKANRVWVGVAGVSRVGDPVLQAERGSGKALVSKPGSFFRRHSRNSSGS